MSIEKELEKEETSSSKVVIIYLLLVFLFVGIGFVLGAAVSDVLNWGDPVLIYKEATYKYPSINPSPTVGPRPLQDMNYFSTLEELQEWLDTNWEASSTYGAWCVESSEILVLQAEEAGYRLYMEILSASEYRKYYLGEDAVVSQIGKKAWPELPDGGAHAVASAIVDDLVYLIEPRSGEVWLFGTAVR